MISIKIPPNPPLSKGGIDMFLLKKGDFDFHLHKKDIQNFTLTKEISGLSPIP